MRSGYPIHGIYSPLTTVAARRSTLYTAQLHFLSRCSQQPTCLPCSCTSGRPLSIHVQLTRSTRPIGPEASEILESSGFDLIRNPEDSEPSREWVLKHLANPDVHGVCIMHPHKSDRVDDEFLAACNPNLKVVSTCSVGFGECIAKPSLALRPADRQTTSTSREQMPRASRLDTRPECWMTRSRTSRLCSCS